MTQVDFTYQFTITRRPTGVETDYKETKIPMKGYVRNMPDEPPDKLIGILMLMPRLKNWHNGADGQGLFYEEMALYNPIITVSRQGYCTEVSFSFSGMISGLKFTLWANGNLWEGTIEVSWPEMYANQMYTEHIRYEVSLTERQFNRLMQI